MATVVVDPTTATAVFMVVIAIITCLIQAKICIFPFFIFCLIRSIEDYNYIIGVILKCGHYLNENPNNDTR